MSEYRTQKHRWFVETGYCDDGGMGYWDGTKESVEVASKQEAEELRDKWLVEGKLRKTHWGDIQGNFDYGKFRIRDSWETVETYERD